MNKTEKEQLFENLKKVGKIFKERLEKDDLISENQPEFPEDSRNDTQKTPQGKAAATDYHYGHA